MVSFPQFPFRISKIFYAFSILFFLGLTTISFAQKLDIQGHRGCRGLYPENSLEGFIHAIDLGVTTLELDVVISADSQVVVSHEPFLSATICLAPNGKPIAEKEEKNFNLFRMTYDSIRACDCGSIPHPKFPQQKKIKTFKPLLSEVIDSVESYCKFKNIPPPFYNIETKITPHTEGKFCPNPTIFTTKVVKILIAKNILQRCILQSFDPRTLQVAHRLYPSLALALLDGSPLHPTLAIQKLGFQPAMYSPYYLWVNSRKVQYLHKKGIKVIPWTVNDWSEMKKMLDAGVDGIITDYPNILIDGLKAP